MRVQSSGDLVSLTAGSAKQNTVPDLACEISVGLLEEKLKHMDPESLPPQVQSHQPQSCCMYTPRGVPAPGNNAPVTTCLCGGGGMSLPYDLISCWIQKSCSACICENGNHIFQTIYTGPEIRSPLYLSLLYF